jgi:pimeloyl-ACP methyl ester carboxylesterase
LDALPAARKIDAVHESTSSSSSSSLQAAQWPLLLLPGLMCDGDFWQPLVAQAGPRPCSVVDYGDADSIEAMADAALVSAPPRFVLAGHSMGGRVALEVVRQAGDRVAGLVLMDTGFLPLAPGEKGVLEAAGRQKLIDVAQVSGVRAMCAQWVRGMVHPDRLGDAALVDAILAMFERKSAERFARQQKALLSRPDATPVLRSLRVPCLLICGRQDGWANVEQHEAMRALAPGAELCVIDHAGHMVLMEKPSETVEALEGFLRQLEAVAC